MERRMTDLSRALAVLRTLGTPMFPDIAAPGTDRGLTELLEAGGVPNVPRVPGSMDARRANAPVVCTHDILERAAILEFCARLPRDEADRLALAEFGVTASGALALLHEAADD